MEYESDLDELIQSDLHSEMNKILDQSDSTATATSSLIVENIQKHSLPNIEDQAKIIPTSSESVEISSEVIDGSQTTEVPVPAKEEDIKLFLDKSPSVSEVKIETPLTEFSGRFSLGRFPTSSSDQLASSKGPSRKTEQNDLSNLGWLRCVDVQPLQCSDTSLPGIEQIQPNSYQAGTSSQMPLCMSEAVNPQDSGVPFCAGQLSNPQSNVSYTSEARPTPRYTPIQPNTNMEGHQRYLMQQRGAASHSLHPFGDRMGGHRYAHQGGFHPYPPPPYGTSGSVYAHEGYHHNRYQSQTQKIFPKPVYSYSCLIAMSLRASKSGCLPVSDIYNFMMENFPYFKTAPDGWKNSVRHNLSLNKCFEKVEKPNGSQRKGCLWALNPAKISKMEEEVQKWKRKDPDAIRKSMSNPEELDRELEEIRRSDEEAARRRMLSMTTHGLSVIPSPHGYHPYSRHNHSNPSHTGHMHPSGTSSLPTTPQHYHHHRPPYRPSMGPGHTMNASPSSYPVMVESNHKRHPRQLFNYPVELRNHPLGSPDVSSTPTSSIKCGKMHDPNVASQMQNASLSSPYSSSSSSGNASFFGALVDSVAASGNDLNDIDLDSSLADLSAFQGSLWEDHNAIVPSQTMVSDVSLHPFEDHLSQTPQPHPRIGSSSSMSALEHTTTSEVAPEPDVFEGTPRFGGDHSYFNGNNKTVMLH